MLEKVRYSDPYGGIGVEAFTDGYAYDDYLHLYLLSAAGRDSSVKAITSAVTSGRYVDILSDRVITVNKPYAESYRILSSKPASGFLHQVVLSDRFFNCEPLGNKLIYVPDGDDVAAAVYEAVRSNYAVPLIPEWSQWLYEKMAEQMALEQLSGNRRVLRLSADEELLDDLVSEGVRNGEITF